jgi:hypothetical protein
MIIKRIIATVFTFIYYVDTTSGSDDWKKWPSILLSLAYLDVAVSALSSTGK